MGQREDGEKLAFDQELTSEKMNDPPIMPLTHSGEQSPLQTNNLKFLSPQYHHSAVKFQHEYWREYSIHTSIFLKISPRDLASPSNLNEDVTKRHVYDSGNEPP